MSDKPTLNKSEFIRLTYAIRNACLEIERCPNDSLQDIFNEMLEKENLPLSMNGNFRMEIKR